MDEQDVALFQACKNFRRRVLHALPEPAHLQSLEARARLRIDRSNARIEPCVGCRAREKARRMSRADLDDAPRPERARHGVGGGAVAVGERGRTRVNSTNESSSYIAFCS